MPFPRISLASATMIAGGRVSGIMTAELLGRLLLREYAQSETTRLNRRAVVVWTVTPGLSGPALIACGVKDGVDHLI